MSFQHWDDIRLCFQWHFNVEATSDAVFNDILTLKQRPTLFLVVFQSWNDVVRLLDITKVNTLSKPIQSPIVETETQSIYLAFNVALFSDRLSLKLNLNRTVCFFNLIRQRISHTSFVCCFFVLGVGKGGGKYSYFHQLLTFSLWIF